MVVQTRRVKMTFRRDLRWKKSVWSGFQIEVSRISQGTMQRDCATHLASVGIFIYIDLDVINGHVDGFVENRWFSRRWKGELWLLLLQPNRWSPIVIKLHYYDRSPQTAIPADHSAHYMQIKLLQETNHQNVPSKDLRHFNSLVWNFHYCGINSSPCL